jgi:hypothetical protein
MRPHPLKLQRHLVRLLAIWKQIADGAHSSVSAFYLIHTAVEKGATNHFGIFFQWRNEHFKRRMLLFSVGNSAMNAPRNWQRRNE